MVDKPFLRGKFAHYILYAELIKKVRRILLYYKPIVISAYHELIIVRRIIILVFIIIKKFCRIRHIIQLAYLKRSTCKIYIVYRCIVHAERRQYLLILFQNLKALIEFSPVFFKQLSHAEIFACASQVSSNYSKKMYEKLRFLHFRVIKPYKSAQAFSPEYRERYKSFYILYLEDIVL